MHIPPPFPPYLARCRSAREDKRLRGLLLSLSKHVPILSEGLVTLVNPSLVQQTDARKVETTSLHQQEQNLDPVETIRVGEMGGERFSHGTKVLRAGSERRIGGGEGGSLLSTFLFLTPSNSLPRSRFARGVQSSTLTLTLHSSSTFILRKSWTQDYTRVGGGESYGEWGDGPSV
ncbi:hypothetical protein IE53DRAFT_236241 [Violaceomyces palustris]|uniref:Uncharacterized protein n=1 Tax=Violaceomyces palustris TaxID=1673888 RepID=A0ACD0NPC9_9BASI|nr:hypothetical protein IE53DRAFT_236241 [Violaceomyces palustris]